MTDNQLTNKKKRKENQLLRNYQGHLWICCGTAA